MNAQIQQAGLLSGRQMTFLVVIGLHALLIAALIAIKVVPPLIEKSPGMTVTIDPPDAPPPLPQPVARSKPVELPNAVIVPVIPVIATPVEAVTLPVESVIATAPADPGEVADVGTPTGTGVALPTHVSTALQYQMTRSSDDYYPDASIRAEERGVAIVLVCVNASGRIEGAPTIQTTSGYKRLDQAAIRWARESLRFVPATQDGVAVAACKGFKVNFALR